MARQRGTVGAGVLLGLLVLAVAGRADEAEAVKVIEKLGGRKVALTKAQVRLAQAAMGKKETKVSELCAELRVTRVTLYRYVGPQGELRDHGRRVLQS